jgi:hypothetical protein
VLVLRYGLYDSEPRPETLHEIGRRLGVPANASELRQDLERWPGGEPLPSQVAGLIQFASE